MESDKDYTHLFRECKPQHYIPNIVKDFKAVSARFLFKAYPELKNYLWNPSYFVAIVSENTKEQIKNYILNQKNEVNCDVIT